MQGSQEFTPSPSTPTGPAGPPPIDLTEVSEETRRALYDATVAVQFRVPPGTESWMPFYNADQARLSVFRFAGRWFATWVCVEEILNENLSEEDKYALLNIVAEPDKPYGIDFHGV